MAEEAYPELKAMTDRLCKLMGWEPGTAHKFEIIRQTCGGHAAALSIQKGNEIADKIEELMKSLCDHQLAQLGSQFIDDMDESHLELDKSHLEAGDRLDANVKVTGGPACWIGLETGHVERLRQAVAVIVDFMEALPHPIQFTIGEEKGAQEDEIRDH